MMWGTSSVDDTPTNDTKVMYSQTNKRKS
eukprot:COSAG02_NODE_33275_length_502_cov_2.148883_1_plen_28_part_10